MIHEHSPKGQIFKNPFLEALTKTSPYITFFSYVPVVILLLVLNFQLTWLTVGKTAILYFSGLFFWTFFEYLMHRYVFHFINDSKLVQRFHYMIHGVHHENPKDFERVFMPPVPGFLIIAITFSIVYPILGHLTFGFLAGWLSGYLFYCYMHFSIHALKPPAFLKKHWTHHTLHHYKYPDKAFGVSSPLWDYVFRTMPPTVEVARNEKGNPEKAFVAPQRNH